MVLRLKPTIGINNPRSNTEGANCRLCAETLRNWENLMSHLSTFEKGELIKVIHKFPVLFGDIPSCTSHCT